MVKPARRVFVLVPKGAQLAEPPKIAGQPIPALLDLLKQAFTSSLRSKIGFLVSRPATELLKHHLDPNNHNGAVFLGLNGVVVKSHGSATAKGVAHAVAVTARLLENKLTERIAHDLSQLGEETLRKNGRGAASRDSETPA